MPSSFRGFPQVGQNDAPLGTGEEQYTHFVLENRFSPDSWLYGTSEIVLIIRKTMISIRPRNMKIPKGADVLKKKNGKMKKVELPVPPLPIIKSTIPATIHRTPKVRKFRDHFNCSSPIVVYNIPRLFSCSMIPLYLASSLIISFTCASSEWVPGWT